MNAHQLVQVRSVEALEGRRLSLTFSDGTSGVADVSELLMGPVFEEIRERDVVFCQVSLDGYGSVRWPNDADLDACVLRDLVLGESSAAH